jgi:ABC-type transport system involved in cytochrome c biogenesis permease subunit
MAAAMVATATASDGLANVGVGRTHFNCVLIVMAVMFVVQVAIVEVIHVIAVLDADVSATGMVFVIVVRMRFAKFHGSFLVSDLSMVYLINRQRERRKLKKDEIFAYRYYEEKPALKKRYDVSQKCFG